MERYISINTKTRLQVIRLQVIHVQKKDVLLLCAWPMRKKLEILSI
jgi:hypothetical protein